MTNLIGSLSLRLCHLALLTVTCIALRADVMPTVVGEQLFFAGFETFQGDDNWSITYGAAEGNWVAEVPFPYSRQQVPLEIAAFEGNRALITGEGTEDLDDGPTMARSPAIPLPIGRDSIILDYRYYFAHRDNGAVTDTFRIEIRRSSDDALLSTPTDEVGVGQPRGAVWTRVAVDLNAYAGESIYLLAYAVDRRQPRSKIEAGLDNVLVTAYSTEIVATTDTVDVFCANFEDDTPENSWSLIESLGANNGDWIRGIPMPYSVGFFFNTQMELAAYQGDRELVTGVNVEEDVDDGATVVRSMDISLPAEATEITIDFHYYFAYYINSSVEDSLLFEIRRASDDAVLVTLANEVGSSAGQNAAWQGVSLDITSLAGEQVYLRALASDYGTQSKVEAAIDDIKIRAVVLGTPPSPSFAGNVYRDYFNNGVRDTVDIGVEGVTVTAYDDDGNIAEQVTTDANGNFNFTTLLDSTNYRVEFANFPQGYYESVIGPDSRTSVQFIRWGGSNADLELGLIDPYDTCEEDPFLILPCYVEGDYNGQYGNEVAIVKVPHSAEGHDFIGTNYGPNFKASKVLSHLEVGSTYGMAYSNRAKRIYAAAFHKRYVGFGPNGPDAIYQFALDGTMDGVIELDALTGLTDVAGSDVHDFSPGAGGFIYDLGANDISFDGPGNRSLGDIELSDDGKTLYVVNLFNRWIYAIDVSSADPSAATLVGEWAAPDATAAARHRPFGLAYHQGRLYVGSVDENGTAAYVHSSDGLSGSFTLELTIDMTYDRQAWFGNANAILDGDWNAWASSASTVNYQLRDGEIAYAQPILTDIEFSKTGDMIIGIRDRFGDQSGAQKRFRPSDTDFTWGVSQGDILKACKSGNSWILETGDTGACATTGGLPSSGPNGREFYYWDIFEVGSGTWNPNSNSGAFHWETAQGGLIQLPGRRYVITTAMDPYNDFSGGLLKLNNDTGDRHGVGVTATVSTLKGGYTIYDGGDFVQNNPPPAGGATASKANGLGDMEGVCNVSIALGNYVWYDENQDGIQDPSEQPLKNVLVSIYKDSLQIGSIVTDALGYYYFGGDSNNGLSAGVSLQHSTDYEIRINMTDAQTNDGTIANIVSPTVLTAGVWRNNNGVISADGSYVSAAVTTGDYGQNNYSIDFGFTACIVTRDTVSYVGCTGDGYSVIVNGVTYSELNPTGQDTMTSQNGCDSIVTIELYYDPTGIQNQTVTYNGCTGDGYAVEVGGTLFDEANPSGIVTETTLGGCDIVTTVNLTFAPSVSVEAGMLSNPICSNSLVNLSDLGASISGGATTGQWSSMGGGTFDNGGVYGGATPATVYTPSALDIEMGEVILTLTSSDPPGACEPKADAVLILINNITCAQFPWAGN